MTLGGWVLFAVLSIFILGICWLVGNMDYDSHNLTICMLMGVILIILLFVGMIWYYNNTQSGKRAFKTQESNLNYGINREVKVYDCMGNIIQEYKGRFDIEYDDDRILFDDENGKRHVIYYPTGTVIVDEVD